MPDRQRRPATLDLLSLITGFQGERLRLARVALGVPLDRLGAEVGTTRAFLHACEQGEKSPPPAMTDALAAALGVTPGFLALPLRDPVRPEQCHFRRARTTPVALVAQVAALATILDGLVSLLDRALELPAVDLPDHPAADERGVEEAAEGARARWGLGTGPVDRVARAAERAGVVVTRFAGLAERVEALSVDRRRPLVVLGAPRPASAARLDLAHELGHLVMHRGVQTGDRATEGQADRFARAFLVPRSALLHEFPRGAVPAAAVQALAARWGLPGAAVLRRAAELGLVDAEAHRLAAGRLARAGAGDDGDAAGEAPELLRLAERACDAAGGAGYAGLLAQAGLAAPMLGAIS